jgi:elongation factor G
MERRQMTQGKISGFLAFNCGATRSSGTGSFFRVYSGSLTKGRHVYNPRTNKRERISRLIPNQADKREDIDTCYSGDIAAIVGSRTSRPATPLR